MYRWTAAAAACGLLLAGCGADQEEPAAAGSAAPPQTASAAGYTPTSDVGGNAAIGKDVAAIRAAIEPEQADARVDFDAAQRIWSEGEFSSKSDGTKRALAGFVEQHPAGARVSDALAGSGKAAGLSEAQRVQWIDKGMVVALKVHALDEFESAKEKLAAGELDPEDGAGHNVDEVWAYFTAEGEGVVATAAKRAKDFGLDEDELGDDVIAGISAAQQAVTGKDAAALEAATERTRGAMNRIFALAVKKYAVEGAQDAKARAEGLAFSWGLVDELGPSELKTIQDAFGEDAPPGAGRTVAVALDGAAATLGLDGPLPAYLPAP